MPAGFSQRLGVEYAPPGDWHWPRLRAHLLSGAAEAEYGLLLVWWHSRLLPLLPLLLPLLRRLLLQSSGGPVVEVHLAHVKLRHEGGAGGHTPGDLVPLSAVQAVL
jgi:hypothetical protein